MLQSFPSYLDLYPAHGFHAYIWTAIKSMKSSGTITQGPCKCTIAAERLLLTMWRDPNNFCALKRPFTANFFDPFQKI